MIDRFDFSYWPPRPHDLPAITPAQSAPSEELTRDVLLIPNDARRAAVYASDDWVDIEDFWVESLAEPHPSDVRSETVIDTMTMAQTNWLRVHGRRHLQNATATFHKVAYELAAYDDNEDPDNEHPSIKVLDEGDDLLPFEGDTRAEGFLYHHVFFESDTRFSSRHILLARQAIVDVYDGLSDLPMGVGKEGQMIIAKVALRWHEETTRLGVRP